ncbi:MAG: TonB family protein [Candidatus Omnitrophota bacterium]
MTDKQVVFYAFIISGAMHIALIGALGGLFNFPVKQSMPKTQVVQIDEKKSPLLPEIWVVGEIKQIVPQQEKQENVQEQGNAVFNAQAAALKLEEIKAEDIAKQAMLRYQDMIKQRIERFRKYPLRARRNQTKGSVGLKFSVFANGTTGPIHIVQSSGSELLDIEALNTIQRSSPFLPIPDELSQQMVNIHVAIVFSLD